AASASPAHGSSIANGLEACSRCQRVTGPNGSSSTSGAISRVNSNAKYGGPTEILPSSSASASSGYNVPSSTIAQAVVSSRLLANSNVSRETGSNDLPSSSPGARNAYSTSEPPMMMPRKIRMNSPRVG